MAQGGEHSGDREDARGLGRDATINAPELARRVEDAGAAAVTVHGRTAAQSYSGFSDWDSIAQRGRAACRSRCSAAATASSRSRSSSG